MTSWAEKYRPKTLDEVVGNPTAIAELRKWAAAWDKGRPDKRAVVLQGDPGIGKTSAALALANEMGWSVVEMNASESRNAEAIHKVATRGAVLQTFTDTGEFVRADEGGRKLIVLDEADNVFGREDRGGIAAIVEMIQTTQQPVALIANDYYALTRRSSSLKRLCKTVKFQRVHEDAMKNILRTISAKEGREVADEVLEVIVERSSGDLRSAINDLESLAVGREAIRAEATGSLGYRGRGGPERPSPRRPARIPILPDSDGTIPRAARRPQLGGEETGASPPCIPEPRPHRAPRVDSGALRKRRRAPDPHDRGAWIRRARGRLPAGRARGEPRGEALVGESRDGPASTRAPEPRRQASFVRRGGGRRGLRREFDSAASSTATSSSVTPNERLATCFRSSITDGGCPLSSWTSLVSPRESWRVRSVSTTIGTEPRRA